MYLFVKLLIKVSPTGLEILQGQEITSVLHLECLTQCLGHYEL
jgi:hypothetical protein